jgi:hypothetical protein
MFDGADSLPAVKKRWPAHNSVQWGWRSAAKKARIVHRNHEYFIF